VFVYFPWKRFFIACDFLLFRILFFLCTGCKPFRIYRFFLQGILSLATSFSDWVIMTFYQFFSFRNKFSKYPQTLPFGSLSVLSDSCSFSYCTVCLIQFIFFTVTQLYYIFDFHFNIHHLMNAFLFKVILSSTTTILTSKKYCISPFYFHILFFFFSKEIRSSDSRKSKPHIININISSPRRRV